MTCVTASNDVVLVATARGYLLRYSWDENGNERVRPGRGWGARRDGEEHEHRRERTGDRLRFCGRKQDCMGRGLMLVEQRYGH